MNFIEKTNNEFVTNQNYSKMNNNDDVYFELYDLVMEAVEMTTVCWRMNEDLISIMWEETD